MQQESVLPDTGPLPRIFGSRKLPYVQVDEADIEGSLNHDVVMFPKLQFRDNIACLRAVSIIAVVFYHFGLAFPGGFAGVDVFFVISGYLITRMTFHEFEQSTFSVLQFWNRRVRRLQPALLVMVACIGTAAHMLLSSREYRPNATSGVFALLSIGNFKFYTQSEYAYHPGERLFLHCWSLAVEVQFYAYYPTVCACLWWLARRCFHSWGRVVVVASSLIFLLAASLLLSVRSALVDPNFAYYMLPARVWEMLAGALAAMLSTNLGAKLGLCGASCMSCLLQVLGLGVVAASFMSLTDATPYPSFALPPCLGSVLVLVADGIIESKDTEDAARECKGGRGSRIGACLRSASTWLLDNGPCVWVGNISYSWYLWHWPVYVLCKRVPALSQLTVEGGLPFQSRIAGVLASFAIACCSYKLVENPCRRTSSMPDKCFWFIVVLTWLAVSLCLYLSSDLYLGQLQDDVVRTVEECIMLRPVNFPEEQWKRMCET